MDQIDITILDSTEGRDLLRAVLDRLIPPDEFPGAWEAGAGRYLARQLAGDAREVAPLLAAGLRALQAEARQRCERAFPALDAAQQDELLAAVEAGEVRTTWPVPPSAFFTALLVLTNEGYYGDPGNGGNQEMISWRMIGYRPGPVPARGGQ